MNFNFSKTYNIIFIFVLLYISLIAGFFLDENLNLGAKPDWYTTDRPVINDLSIDFQKTLLNYEIYNHRHSPVYLIFLSLLKKTGISFEFIRFIHLNISISYKNYFDKLLDYKTAFPPLCDDVI